MKLATLSFDDGGWQEPYLLDALNRLGIAATFYLCSSWLDETHYHMESVKIAPLYAGHEIGCHTATHPDLRRLPPFAWADEIVAAREVLESVFDRRVESFSWPFGAVNPELIPELHRAGFKGARGVKMGDPTRGGPYDYRVTAPWPIPTERWGALLNAPTIHVFGHAYQIRDDRDLPRLTEFCGRLFGAGFGFVVNSEFWRLSAHAEC